jgi:hypothetical protein
LVLEAAQDAKGAFDAACKPTFNAANNKNMSHYQRAMDCGTQNRQIASRLALGRLINALIVYLRRDEPVTLAIKAQGSQR